MARLAFAGRRLAERRLRRQSDAHGAAASEDGGGGLVIDIDIGADGVRPRGHGVRRRQVVDLHQPALIGEFAGHAALAHGGDEDQAGEDHLLAGAFQPLHDLGYEFVVERLALGADHFAHHHPVERRLAGHAEIEVAPDLWRPVIKHRPEGQLQRRVRGLGHRHDFR